jgi:CelD/BcsL family acetyltransferase involved in cellulose biosynthesis
MSAVLLDGFVDAAHAFGHTVLDVNGIPTFRVSRRLGLNFATAIGDPLHPYPAQLQPMLADAKGLASAIRTAQNSHIDVIRLRYLPESAVPDLKELPTHTRSVVHHTCIADLNSDIELTDVKKLVRQRTKWIQLARDVGEIRFQVVRDLQERKQLIETMIAWKRAWFAEHRLAAVGFNDPFHICCLQKFADLEFNDVFRIHVLLSGDVPVAAEVCLAEEKSLHNVIIAVNPSYRRYGPGVLLSRMAINTALSEEFLEVDFLPPYSSHKNQIAKKTVAKTELQVPLTRKGILALKAKHVADTVRLGLTKRR